MFIRTKTTPNSPRRSVQVVESFRDDKSGKVKQKIVRYVGIALDDEDEAKLRAMAQDYIAKLILEKEGTSGQLSLLSPSKREHILEGMQHRPAKRGRRPQKRLEQVLPVDQVSLGSIVEEARVIDGVHEVAGHMYDTMGYGAVLKSKKQAAILKDLVLSRISDPKSKLATCAALKRYYMKEHDVDAIYRTMDSLYENINLMRKLTFTATQNLLPGSVDLILFDVTTLHFESTEVDALRRFGYSKSFRFNTTQVVLALATNADGLPIGYELFEGNQAEVGTLIKVIEGWQTQFNIGKVCFIGDRAMFSENNLDLLDQRGYSYIVAAKLRSLPQVMMDKVLDETQYHADTVVSELVKVAQFRYEEADLARMATGKNGKVSAQKIKAYRELIDKNKGRKIVVSCSEKRASHDQKQREVMLAKISKQLNKETSSAKLISNAALKKYTSSTGRAECYIDSNKVEKDTLWDGLHGVITNLPNDVSPAQVLAQYKRLVKIEDCFRVNKHTMKMRPIYHFKPERIKAHVAICYMAFAVVRQIEYRVKLQKKLSIDSIIEELNSVQSSIYVHKVTQDKYRMPGSFSNLARKIYAAIGVQRNLVPTPIL